MKSLIILTIIFFNLSFCVSQDILNTTYKIKRKSEDEITMKIIKYNSSQDTIITYGFPRIARKLYFYINVNQRFHRLEGAYFDGKYFDAIKYFIDFGCDSGKYYPNDTSELKELTDYEKTGRIISCGSIEPHIVFILPGKRYKRKVVFRKNTQNDSDSIFIVDRSVSTKFIPKQKIFYKYKDIEFHCIKEEYLMYGVKNEIKLW